MIRFPMILRAPEGEGGGGGAGGEGGQGAGQGGAGAGSGAGAGGAGAGAPPAAWYDTMEGLEQEDRTFLAGKGFADVKTAMAAHRQADTLARDRNVLPKPDPAKLNEWPGWAELGWKSDAGEYGKGIKKPQVPGDFRYDENFQATFSKAMHDGRVPQPIAQLALDTVINYAVDAIKAVDASGANANVELDKQLKAEWGASYESKKELSQRAFRHFGITLDDGADLEAFIGKANMMKMFATIGEQLGEDVLITPRDGSGAGQMSLSQVQAELDRQAGDKEFMAAFTDPRHPRHAEVRQQRDSLVSKKAKLAGG